MKVTVTRTALLAASVGIAAATLPQAKKIPLFQPTIPKVWDDEAVRTLEIPLAQRDHSPHYISAGQYYAMKVRKIYRAYPAYVRGREPAGYLESLKEKEPEVTFDTAHLHTRADWIAAGKLVFESDTLFYPAKPQPSEKETAWPVSKEGKLPFFFPGYRYYVRKKGVLEFGTNSCAGCHTRVMPDGSFVEGGQGSVNQPKTAAQLEAIRTLPEKPFRELVDQDWIDYGVPWVTGEQEYKAALTREHLRELAAADHPGVFARQGTSLTHPVHIPALIGVADRKFLDSTGLVHNRSIADLMRYAALNEGLDTMGHFGDFQPSPGATDFSGDEGTRYSDEQLYALALYVESLTPPPNPNKNDALAHRGEQVFADEGCPRCHTPPLYTNNKLNPVKGFTAPQELTDSGVAQRTSVGTDATLALQSRRSTGFYKVPSLRGVWFRNGFGHAGQAETLEEWFNPDRQQPNYVPKGYHLQPGAIEGHPFGLDLSSEDRTALIAFLKTL